MPYLASVAALELARHHAYHAEDKQALSIDEFAQLPPEQLAQAMLVPHPSLYLVNAEYAVFTIWQMHQPNHNIEGETKEESNEENIDINEPEHILIVRP